MTLTVGSLFSGIGGFDLGLERAGMKVIWQSEIDEFASKVLKKHWPDVPNLGDITKVDWSKVERPDVICGGYPCQPFSHSRQTRRRKRRTTFVASNAQRHLRTTT
jgi:DNA (cytosine-5)-methyltransferase 1